MFNLTRQERRVVLFLAVTALIGIGINFLAKMYSPIKTLASLNENLAKINLNKADKELLLSLPGIGETLAQRIIDYRKENNGFNSIEELKSIKGITHYRYEKIKDFFLVQ